MRYYEKIKVEPDRPQMTIWRMRIPKSTHTHTHTHTLKICGVILAAFPLLQWLHKIASNVTLHLLPCLH